jgi:carbonic anhydrase
MKILAQRSDGERFGKTQQIPEGIQMFCHTEKSVRATMHRGKNHPLVPDNIIVRGFIIDYTTGALSEVTEQSF